MKKIIVKQDFVIDGVVLKKGEQYNGLDDGKEITIASNHENGFLRERSGKVQPTWQSIIGGKLSWCWGIYGKYRNFVSIVDVENVA